MASSEPGTEPQPMTTMTPEALEYERAAKTFGAARGKDERDAARRRWDAAKADLDRAIAEHRDAYHDGYERGRAEAIAAERQRVREAVEGLEERNDADSVAEGYSLVRRSDAIAIIDGVS